MTKPILQYILSVGMLAKGAIYVAVGAIALRVAAGFGGEAESTDGALDAIGRQPFGNVALALLFLGLLHFAAWKLAQAILDPEELGEKRYGGWLRAWFGVVGLAHLYFAYATIRRVLSGWGLGQESSDEQVESWTSVVLGWPGGPLLVGAAGLAAFCVCAGQIVFAYRAKFADSFCEEDTGARARHIMIWLGRAGMGARAIVSAIIGVFFLQAMRTEDPSDAGGVSDALQSLLKQPFGPWLLGAAALGLLAFGFFFWGLSRYQAVDKESKA